MPCRDTGRRNFLAQVPALAALAAALPTALLAADAPAIALIRKPIPSSGELIPIVGLGTARSYEEAGSETEMAPLRATLPDWAAEFDCKSWAQFFLKYLVSHEAVTCVVPGMAKPEYVIDNLGAATGRLPDATMRKRMEAYIDGL